MAKKKTLDKLEINETNLSLLIEKEYNRQEKTSKIIKKSMKMLLISLGILLVAVYVFAMIMLIVTYSKTL